MVDLAPSISRNVLTALLSQPPKDGGLRRWLFDGTYQLSEDADGIVLSGIDVDRFAPYLFFDYSRFSFASRESISLSFQRSFDSRALAWMLLKRYYASFFAAHGILRSQGRGIIWLDSDESSHLQRLARIYIRQDFSLSAGAYRFIFSPNGGYDATLSLVKVGSRGGSHEEFWKYFSQFITDYSNDLLAKNAPDAADFAARIADLKLITCAYGLNQGTWLSFMRNEINYQQKFGAWFPFSAAPKIKLQEANIFKFGNAGLNLTVSPKSSPISAFSSATCFLALVSLDLANVLKARAGSGALQFRRDWDRLSAALGDT